MPRINALGTILTVSPACNRSPAMDVGANCWSWSSNCTQALGSLSRSPSWDGSSAIYMDCVREKPMGLSYATPTNTAQQAGIQQNYLVETVSFISSNSLSTSTGGFVVSRDTTMTTTKFAMTPGTIS